MNYDATDNIYYRDDMLGEVAQIAHQLETERASVTTLQRTLIAAMKEAYGPHTLQQIGEAAGLSRQRVEQLIKKEEK